MSDATTIAIRPDLIAALDHYSRPLADPWNSVFIHVDPQTRHQSLLPVGRACELAHAALSREDLNLLKLASLKRGMERLGLGRLFDEIIDRRI